MAFRYTNAPLTQSLSSLVLLGGCAAVMQVSAVQALWASMVDGLPHGVLMVLVPLGLHLLVFWGMSAAFGWVDRNNTPHWIARYRIQSGRRRQPPWPKVLRNLLVNQLVLSPLLLAALWGALVLRGWAPSPTLPSVGTLLVELAGLSVCSVLWFYASHRFLHRPYWMKRVHRVHHEFRTTSAVASEYAHPVEFVFGSFGTLACGVLLLAPSLLSIYLYTVMSLHVVLAHHSGYAVPWLSWAVPHDWHHYKFNEVFGTVGVLDRLLKTDTLFRELEDGKEYP